MLASNSASSAPRLVSPPGDPNHIEVEVLRIRPETAAGAIKAFACVRLGSVTLSGWRIVEDGQGALSVQEPGPGSTGDAWFPGVRIMDARLDRRVKRAVLDTFQAQGAGGAA